MAQKEKLVPNTEQWQILRRNRSAQALNIGKQRRKRIELLPKHMTMQKRNEWKMSSAIFRNAEEESLYYNDESPNKNNRNQKQEQKEEEAKQEPSFKQFLLIDERNKAASEEPPKQWAFGPTNSHLSSGSDEENEDYAEDEGLTNYGVGIPFDKAFIKLAKLDFEKVHLLDGLEHIGKEIDE